MAISIPAYGIDGLVAGFTVMAAIDTTDATATSPTSPGSAKHRTPYLIA